MRTTLVMLAAALLIFIAVAPARGTDDEGDAAAAARNIKMELQSKRSSMSAYSYIDLAERLWSRFLEKYPSAPEAAEAHLNLGFIYAQTGRHEIAIQHLEGYKNVPGEKRSQEEAKALVTLAGSYMALERFDEAEVLLKKLAEPSSGRDYRINQMASRQLAMIGSLRKLKIGLPALVFSAKTHDGKRISLDDYKGKVVLLDFWASWCNPCRAEMPNVKKVYKEYRDKGFEIIGISLDDKEANFKRYMDSEKMPWPQIFDGKGWRSEIGQLYAVTAIPATYILDRDGIIRYKNARGKELGKAVKELIGKEWQGSSRNAITD
jgi:peroxiredoxin